MNHEQVACLIGGIRGGRGQQGIAAEVVRVLRKHGFEKILNEHIADPELSVLGQRSIINTEIKTRSLYNIEQAMFFIIIVTEDPDGASYGVGYEYNEIERSKKPALCLCQTNDKGRLSAMLANISDAPITFEKFTTIKDVEPLIVDFLEKVIFRW